MIPFFVPQDKVSRTIETHQIFHLRTKARPKRSSYAVLSGTTFRVSSVNARASRGRKRSPHGTGTPASGASRSFLFAASSPENCIGNSPYHLWTRTNNAYRSRTTFARTMSRGNIEDDPLGSSRRHCTGAAVGMHRATMLVASIFRSRLRLCNANDFTASYTLPCHPQGGPLAREGSSPSFMFLGYFKSGFDLFSPLAAFLTRPSIFKCHVSATVYKYRKMSTRKE